VEIDFAGNPYGCGWHIDRNRFDLMLCQRASAAGARLFLDRSVKWIPNVDGWQAENSNARFLVNATGRHGMGLDRSTVREREDDLLSVVFRMSGWADDSHDLRTCIEAAPGGWWYSAPLPDGSRLAMFFTGSEIYREHGISIEEQLQSAPLTRRRLGSGRASPARITNAVSGLSTPVFGENWLAVGDSASCYDPLSGRGIFKALRHGELAAGAIDACLRGNPDSLERYSSHIRQEFEAYSRQRRQFYAAEQRWADHPFWRARGSGNADEGGGASR
jgi:flavin-dependent dehydrogenase